IKFIYTVVYFTCFGLPIQQAAGQEDHDDLRRATEAVEALNGKIERDEDDPSTPVIKVDLAFTPASDSTIKYIKIFNKLKYLNIGGTDITDAGIEHIDLFKMLEVLDFGATQFKGFDGEFLYYCESSITDNGFKNVCNLNKLKCLYIGGGKI